MCLSTTKDLKKYFVCLELNKDKFIVVLPAARHLLHAEFWSMISSLSGSELDEELEELEELSWNVNVFFLGGNFLAQILFFLFNVWNCSVAKRKSSPEFNNDFIFLTKAFLKLIVLKGLAKVRREKKNFQFLNLKIGRKSAKNISSNAALLKAHLI